MSEELVGRHVITPNGEHGNIREIYQNLPDVVSVWLFGTDLAWTRSYTITDLKFYDGKGQKYIMTEEFARALEAEAFGLFLADRIIGRAMAGMTAKERRDHFEANLILSAFKNLRPHLELMGVDFEFIDEISRKAEERSSE